MLAVVVWALAGLVAWFALALPLAILVGRSIGARECRVAEVPDLVGRAA